MRLLFKSTHLVHPCIPHHSGTPLENSGTPWGVQYTRLTSTGLEQLSDEGALDIAHEICD